MRNHKKEAVNVRVVEHLYRWTNWNVIAESDKHLKTDAQTIEVPDHGTAGRRQSGDLYRALHVVRCGGRRLHEQARRFHDGGLSRTTSQDAGFVQASAAAIRLAIGGCE